MTKSPKVALFPIQATFHILNIWQTVQMVIFIIQVIRNVSCFLLSTGKVFKLTYINYLYKMLLFDTCGSVVSLASSFFLVVVTVKFGSVKGFQKCLPVISTYNQIKGNIFLEVSQFSVLRHLPCCVIYTQ